MKNLITRKSVIIGLILLIISMFFVTGWLFSSTTFLFNDTVISNNSYHAGESNFGWIHFVVNFLDVILIIILVISFILELVNDKYKRPFEFLYINSNKNLNENKSNYITKFEFSFKRIFIYGFLIYIIFYGIGLFKTIYRETVFVYNTSKMYQNTYQQKVEEKIGFYDKLWKTYLQKEKITNINKETFLRVTKIIMENRKDSKNITWKWVHENQQIPYDEFTKFYADLSNFITEQRSDYFKIEKDCQLIANKNNTLLDTFPNNIYNKILKLPKIKFEYGFLSDSTNNVFINKIENIK